ncbi:hypothetical protein AWE51_24195 [Aquimarina aggregata]|uniref:Uncharacterized protein n=1 Tax=Aquimarina aggregata TaxID=1642818 RepID=A0A163AYZ0_9FLAO|nr:hypothetical protein [Aquimarina aggregata]KZS40907.1 hypothetical protein AWE51_24195 [Aquimarina aggregata]
MLKGKKGLYILLPLVVFIWGAIIFQITDAFTDDDPEIANIGPIAFSKIESKERDRFSISDVTRDPFLGTVYKPKKEPVKKVAQVKKTVINWPSIRYKGVVTGGNGATAIYLVEINGTDQLMKRKDVISEVKLTKGNSSWVQLQYKGKIKRFEILK